MPVENRRYKMLTESRKLIEGQQEDGFTAHFWRRLKQPEDGQSVIVLAPMFHDNGELSHEVARSAVFRAGWFEITDHIGLRSPMLAFGESGGWALLPGQLLPFMQG